MQTLILEPTPEHLRWAAAQLQQGELVAIPTETVYGLAGNALDPDAVAKIFAAKERPSFDPLIVHIAKPDLPGSSYVQLLQQDWQLVDLRGFSTQVIAELEKILCHCWPGPLTIVLPKQPHVPDLVTSGLPTVAIRMPDHPVAQQLLQETQLSLAAPSANRFGRISPTTAAAVYGELRGRISLILDGGPCSIGVESSIIALDPAGHLTLMRPGGVGVDQLHQITQLPIQRTIPGAPVEAPGQLLSHYAPRKPLWMLPAPVHRLSDHDLQDRLRRLLQPEIKCGLLCFQNQDPHPMTRFRRIWGVTPHVEILSPQGDLGEAARTLFTKLRELDEGPASILFTEPCPHAHGLGYAIADRLGRASHPLPD
ncbi:MAG: threonylcarbamoyl-AMP synthase [Synechococcaceae cyanobacterium SM2_3_1]|nr:threonylcarbamoyl-AMP synthase [Synechococcaceae cyanobacterium SM2_3_1]